MKSKKKAKVSKKDELKSLIDLNNIPRHIAIIMDGNGRWAKKRLLPRIGGHRVGVESVHVIVEECVNFNVEVLTLYAFSAENWRRPKKEVNFLMKLLVEFLKKDLARMHRNNVRLRVSGEVKGLPDFVQEEIQRTEENTASNTGLILNLALNYSSQVEITEATKKIASGVKTGEISLEDITPEFFSKFLYTGAFPELDLLIRTSGEWRISNFLLWQLAYSEIYITDTFWPDFREEAFYEALLDYQKRERRFGKTGLQVSRENKFTISSN